jgi:SnoaL-like domain
MTDFDRLAQAYISTWNEHDGERRLRLVQGLFEPDASYVDPMASVQGTSAINGLIGAVQDQFPGYVFQLVGTPDGHHDQLRFRWGLISDGQDPEVIGFDVVQLGSRGSITQVLGFLDKVPAAPTAA